VHSESEESPYVAARPFRVNAGGVYAYILVGEKTRYLSELESGDDVLIVNAEGNARKGVVGRVKIENILQNAETIKLVGKDKKKPISVVDLKAGDEVLVHVTETARHFGIAVEEMVIEK
jgi:3-dehydroquinate synthase II